MDVISTKQVAELLAVSEATVKRWADAGTLKCFRTPGGHRKFRVGDVAEFLRTHNYDAIGTAEPGSSTAAAATALRAATEQQREASTSPVERDAPAIDPELIVRFRNLALAGDPDALVSYIAQLRLRGHTLVEVCDHIAAPALHDIGDRWARGVLTVTQEHIAAQAVIEALARIRPLVERPNEDRGRVMFACPGDEQHDIGLRMAALLAHGAGFTSVMIGARAPAADLALMVTAERPRAVVLSAAASSNPEHLSHDVATISEASRGAGSRLFIGGAGFDALPSLPQAARLVRNFADLLDVLRGVNGQA